MGLVKLRWGIGDQICVVTTYIKVDVIPFVLEQFLQASRRNNKGKISPRTRRASLWTLEGCKVTQKMI